MEALRSFWRFISYNWKFGLFLVLLFGIPRFIMVLDANASGGYGTVSILFLVMWFTPFIFLSKEGQKYIGIKKPVSYQWLLYSFLIGFAFCSVMFICAKFFYADTINNSFVYISRSYTIPGEALAASKLMFFLMFSLVGITFSPIGEELLYRGVVHGSFAEQFGERKASLFDSLAFALTHLAHFGIVYNLSEWHFLPVPALLWVLGMFIASQFFFFCRQKSGSILGAIVSHAGYNIAMMYFIFYHIF
jgi:membrane protease YdiL (CAAX protease family)